MLKTTLAPVRVCAKHFACPVIGSNPGSRGLSFPSETAFPVWTMEIYSVRYDVILPIAAIYIPWFSTTTQLDHAGLFGT